MKLGSHIEILKFNARSENTIYIHYAISKNEVLPKLKYH